ncbi:hypothetical protein, variant 2 [Verruconis gallopava]|nr:hypothetical protein, variant 1 [Verruconis gallopava]XP_016215432.1 hypothetical protein, variant 2 [Verruconis gallopava]KIW05562.1 hypothetical protein, variant 1 [Verruconis gallopava]KIW05563.1 hypothetical protein, variant 2 [Verruconis gallopava]
MLAAEAKQVEVGKLLIAHFPRCVPWANKAGMDALMISSRSGALPLLPLLLTSNPPASPTAYDNDGNTALHHASAAGELKALRVLLQYGANPLAQNNYSWTPIAYSSTVAAEVYFKQLVTEMEMRRMEGLMQEREREAATRQQRIGGVRLVTQDDGGAPLGSTVQFRQREDSLSNLARPSAEWSPVERRAMTPTDSQSTPTANWNYGRGRASSGD